MIQRVVAPEHQLTVVRLQKITYAIEMLKINCADATSSCCPATLSFTQLESFIFADVKELSRKKLVQLAVPIRDQLVSTFLLRREDVAIGSFCQRIVLLQLQRLVEMAERLLFGNDLDVVRASI